MAKTLAQATAAPKTVTLKDGTKLTVCPLQDKDYGEFELWMQDEALQLGTRNLKGLDPVAKKLLIAEAYATARRLTVTSHEALESMVSINGAAKLLLLSIRRNHPEVTIEDILSMLADPDNLDRVIDSIKLLNTSSGTVKKVRGRRKSAKKRKKKKQR